MQRLRLKGKTIHLLAFEKANHHLLSLADYQQIFNRAAPFLRPITMKDRDKWAEDLMDDQAVYLLLYQLDKLEKKKEFVGLSYFHRAVSSKFEGKDMDEALTKALKAGLIASSYVPNPNDPKNPTSTIKVNRENEVSLKILSS